MWSAAFLLLSFLKAFTQAQYGVPPVQHTYARSSPVRNGNGYMPGYNPHDQSLYYFPPPSIPRPDGKYVRTRSQKWMNAAKKADLPALEVFVRTQGKVNFTIRNLGPHPAYGPFSLSSTEFSKTNSRTAQKEMPTKETVNEVGMSDCQGESASPPTTPPTTQPTATTTTTTQSLPHQRRPCVLSAKQQPDIVELSGVKKPNVITENSQFSASTFDSYEEGGYGLSHESNTKSKSQTEETSTEDNSASETKAKAQREMERYGMKNAAKVPSTIWTSDRIIPPTGPGSLSTFTVGSKRTEGNLQATTSSSMKTHFTPKRISSYRDKILAQLNRTSTQSLSQSSTSSKVSVTNISERTSHKASQTITQSQTGGYEMLVEGSGKETSDSDNGYADNRIDENKQTAISSSSSHTEGSSHAESSLVAIDTSGMKSEQQSQKSTAQFDASAKKSGNREGHSSFHHSKSTQFASSYQAVGENYEEVTGEDTITDTKGTSTEMVEYESEQTNVDDGAGYSSSTAYTKHPAWIPFRSSARNYSQKSTHHSSTASDRDGLSIEKTGQVLALQREYQKSISSTVLPSTPTKLDKPDVPTSSQTYLPPCRKRKHFNASAMSLSKSSVNITSKTSKITNESYTLSTETHESISSKSDLINNVISQNVEVSSQVSPVTTVKAAYTGSPAYVPLIRNGRNTSRNATTYTSGRVFQYVADKVKSKSSLSMKKSNHTSRQVTSTQVKYQENTFETSSPSIPSTSLSTSTTTPNAPQSSRSYYAQSETRKEQQVTVTNAQSASESRSSVSSTDYRSNSSIWSIQTQRNDGSEQTDTFTQQTKMISSSQTPAASVAKNNSISVHSNQNRIDNSEFSSRNEKTVVDMATHDGEDEYSEEIEYELESSEENSLTGPDGRSSTATRSAGSDKINPPGFGPPKGVVAVQSSTVPTTAPPPDTPSNPITYSENSTSYPVTTSVPATVPASASTPSPTSVRTSTSPQPPPEDTVQPLEPQGPLPSGASSLPATTVPPSEVHPPSASSIQPRTAVAASFQNNSGLPLPPAPQPETPAPAQIPASQVPLQPLNPTEGLTEPSSMLSGGSALQTNQITYQSTSDGSSNSNSLSPSPSVPEYGQPELTIAERPLPSQSVQPQTVVDTSFGTNSGWSPVPAPLPESIPLPLPEPSAPASAQISASQVAPEPLNPIQGLTETSLELPDGHALQISQNTYESTSDSSSQSNSLSPLPSIPEYEIGNSLPSSRYGGSVQVRPSVLVDENRPLSRGEGLVDELDGEEDDEEGYSDESKEVPESVENGNVDGTSAEDATQNKFGSQTVNTKSIPQQIQVESAKMEELNVDNDKYGRRSQIDDTDKKSTTKIGSLDSSPSGNVFAIRSPGNGVVGGGYLGLPSPELFGAHRSYLAVPAGAGQVAVQRFQDGCCGGSWFSRSGKFCTPINLEPCIPLIPRACVCLDCDSPCPPPCYQPRQIICKKRRKRRSSPLRFLRNHL